MNQLHLRQLALQSAAAIIVLSLTWPFASIADGPLAWPKIAIAIGAVAWTTAKLTRQTWWWQTIHALFAPLAWFFSTLSIAPIWFLLAFILMFVVYRGALSGQIPLYLSNNATAATLVTLVSNYPNLRFIDLGAGIGSVVRALAKARPDAWFTGVENAPATWAIGYVLTAGFKNCHWCWADIWRTNLADYDVVYAFLSPTPMTALWEKAQREMPAGSMLISNSFEIPGVDCTQIIDVGDSRQTRLYCYRLPYLLPRV